MLLNKGKLDYIIYLISESLNESIEIGNNFQEIIDKFNLPMPNDDNIGDIDKIELEDDISSPLAKIKKGEHNMKIKIGKLLNYLYPELDKKTSNEIIGYIKAKYISQYKFKVYDSILEWYDGKKLCIETCMTENEGIYFYENNAPENIQIVICYDGDKPVGRALLWKVYSKDTNKEYKFLDRTYPASDDSINKAYQEWAKENGYLYRKTNLSVDRSITGDGSEDMVVYALMNVSEVEYMPFIDTLQYGKITSDYKLYLTNENEKTYFDFSSADGETVIFENYFRIPEWLLKLDIDMNDFNFDKFFSTGEIEFDAYFDIKDITWVNGTLICYSLSSSIFLDGIYKGNKAVNCEWEGGVYESENEGDFIDGKWNNGVFNNPTGTFENSEFNNGVFMNGTWEHDSTWNGGKWVRGYIKDPKKEGNFKNDWEWKNDYVLSYINPVEYFNKNKKVKLESFKKYLYKNKI